MYKPIINKNNKYVCGINPIADDTKEHKEQRVKK